jgi:adenosylhomocysteine nucleosidase
MLAIANGIGQERAGAAVKAAVKAAGNISAVWSIGTAGALDPSLDIADVVAATEVTDGRQVWQANAPEGPAVRSGLVRTSQHIARTSVEKKNLHATGAIIVDMEAAAVVREASEMAVPFYCVRGVSDHANETFFIDFESFFMPNGTLNVPRLVIYALAHPMDALPELIRLQRRSSLAARRLAGFLAACQF